MKMIKGFHAVALVAGLLVGGAESVCGAVFVESFIENPNHGERPTQLGDAVAIDGDVMVLGARDTTVGTRIMAGTARVYRRDGLGEWNYEQELRPSDLADFDRFGCSVAVSGNTILVGSFLDSPGGSA